MRLSAGRDEPANDLFRVYKLVVFVVVVFVVVVVVFVVVVVVNVVVFNIASIGAREAYASRKTQ